MSAYHELKGETKNVFFYFINARDGHLTNQELISLSNLDKSTLTYHTKKLSSEKMALIKRDSNSKVIDWVLTDTGRRVLRRLKNESKKTN